MSNIIQISCLGDMGRFGNQLWQYAFAKTYANKTNSILEVPVDWIGRRLFNIEDPVISKQLPRTEIDYMPSGETNIDLCGYYQHQKFADMMDADEVKEWFAFRDEWENRFPKIKNYYVAAHVRLGDYCVMDRHCTISLKSYEKAIVENGYKLEDVEVVSEENQHPLDTRNYGSDKGYYSNIDFIFDFFLVRNADIIFRSHSTFGWWAAFLSKKGTKIYSPIIQGLAGKREADVEFVEGNWPCHIEIDDRHSDLFLGEEILNGTT